MSERSGIEIVRRADAEALGLAAAERVVALAASAIEADGVFSVALTGGSSPAGLYRALAGPLVGRIDWNRVKLFWGDERCVEPTSEESNYALAGSTLLAGVPISPGHVFRIAGEQADTDAAAREYEATLRRELLSGPGGLPKLSLVLLGMGPDGHCASLFPHKPALRVRDRLAVRTEPGLKPFVERITLTYPMLNAADAIWFLAPDPAKAARIAEVIAGPRDPDRLPAQAIAPNRGKVTWFLTDASARMLPAD